MTNDDDLTKPAFRYPSSGKRPEALNVSRGTNAPLQLLRGWAAGTLGLPGDIEGIVRALRNVRPEGGQTVEPESFLPTSEFYQEWIPGQDKTPAGKLFAGAGSLAGGLGAGRAAGALERGARATAKTLGPTAGRMAGQYMQAMGVMPSVVKPKGGNWLPESVDSALGYLKAHANPEQALGTMRQQLEMGAPAGTRAYYAERIPRMEQEAAINQWIDKKLGKYVRNEMATPEDPVRKLAEQGRLHFEAPYVEPTSKVDENRRLFAKENNGKWGYGQNQLAQNWEDAADRMLNVVSAESIQSMNPATFNRNWPGMEWVHKLNPETPLYGLNRGVSGAAGRDPSIESLGFDHLIDELRNATRANSDLPPHLRYKLEDLNKVTVPQAVERVAKINAWRAEQAEKALAESAVGPATVEHKAYQTVPGTDLPNEKGLRWVELKMPADTGALPEGYSVSTITNENLPVGHMGRDSYAVVDPQGRMIEGAGMAYTQADALDKFRKAYYNKSLEDALGYEGKLMGHCVGGYCPEVAEGRSRIFSLRDAKGKPHVTIEVKPGERLENATIDDIRDKLAERYGDASRKEFEDAVNRYIESREIPDEIVQIKGKANLAPKEEYLPFVQDFVRGGQWGRVGDVENTGMRPTREVFSHEELRKLRDLGETNIPSALTGTDIQRLHNMIIPEGQRLKYDARGNVIGSENPNYAGGGLIKKILGTATKPVEEAVDLTKRGMFKMPEPSMPIAEIPKNAPTVTEKTVEVAPEGVKGEKVTKSVIDTPVSRRTVIKSAGSQAAQRVLPKAVESGIPQMTAKEIFGQAKSLPDIYMSMIPLVRKHAPEELANMADRLGFSFDDIIAMSGQDVVPAGDLTREGLLRFEELFPTAAAKIIKKAGGGLIKKGIKAITKVDEPVDLARRSIFKLPESPNLPATVPVSSGLSVLDKAAQTPVSRRDILRSAAGQAARSIMPSGLEATVSPVAKQLVTESFKPAVSSADFSNPMAMVFYMLRMGKSESEIASVLNMDPSSFNFRYLINKVKNPENYLHGEAPTLKTPSEAMSEILETNGDRSIFSTRPVLRELQKADPSAVSTLTEAARSVSSRSQDIARDIGLKQKWIDRYMKGEIKYDDLPAYYKDRIDEAFDSYAGGGLIKKILQAGTKAEPAEQKMLQGFYRGYAGDYDAQKAAQDAGMVFVTPQRPAGEYYANKRAKQMKEDPHLEMILADPFAGRAYGHSIPTGPENKKVDFTKARQLAPEDVKSTTKLYAKGGRATDDQLRTMVQNAMKSGMSEKEALRQFAPLCR